MNTPHGADYAAVLRGIRADGDLILGDALAEAEAQRAAVEPKIQAFEASRRRRNAVRKAARLVVLTAVVLTVVWLFAGLAR